jgi:hypothetical protein
MGDETHGRFILGPSEVLGMALSYSSPDASAMKE